MIPIVSTSPRSRNIRVFWSLERFWKKIS